MSLDLIKNALYAAVKNATSGVAGLTFYPEAVDYAQEVFPNLSFLEIDTEHIDRPSFNEEIDIPTGTQPPFNVVPVIAHKRSRIRLILRDSLGAGPHDANAFGKVRGMYNAVDRFFSTLKTLNAGPTGQQTLAEFYYRSARQDTDRALNIHQATFEIDIDPWRLLDTSANAVPTYQVNTLEIDVVNQPDGALWITRLYPNPAW
jgi:hypothetical protein